jgi:hypothetical protein
MPNNPVLRLRLVDVYGKYLGEKVDIIFQHQVLNRRSKASEVVSKDLDIVGLDGAPQGRYRMDIDPPSYQYSSIFVNMKAGGVTNVNLQFVIDPSKVTKVNFPTYSSLSDELKTLIEKSDKVLSFTGQVGKALYDSIDDLRRAGLLNIATKTGATKLANGRTVLSYIQNVTELRGDRFFGTVSQELREEIKNSVDEGLFHEAGQLLHHPPEGYSHAKSFKTPDRYGNLQLTFFNKGSDWVADIDIDDAGGLEHVFQVVRNKLSGKPTHPYNIHEVLVGYQHLDPNYTFSVKSNLKTLNNSGGESTRPAGRKSQRLTRRRES